MRNKGLAAFALALLAGGCGQGTPAPDASANIADPDVRRLHAAMLEAMGGARAWEQARYFEFEFAAERDGQAGPGWSHRWDRWTGDHRVSGNRAGHDIVVLMNANRRDEGRAWRDGAEVTDAAALDSLRTFGYGRLINDSYWLLMPYKWTDPGVILSYDGPFTDDDGRRWERVHLRFEGVGLTPQNQYLGWINPATGLMERWSHFSREGADPLVNDWTDWRPHGPILLSTRKPNVNGQSAIIFRGVRVETRVPAGAFDPPA
jgi:hypothetical protein